MRQAVKNDASKAWDRLRSLASAMDKRKPGAGEELLTRAARTLDRLHDEALSGVSGFQGSGR